jgi:hypothetical protein
MPVLKKYDEKGAYFQYEDFGAKYYAEEFGEEESLKMALQQSKEMEKDQALIEKEKEYSNEDKLSFSKDSFFIEINKVNLDDVSGRVKIKMSAHEIYRSDSLYNKNGITWTLKGTEDNIKSAIGMPYIARFLDEDQEVPYDHGTQEYDEDGNVSFPDSDQVGSVQKAYVEEVNGKLLLMTEGYLSAQRYPRFAKWLKNVIEQGQNIYGSVEINGKGNSKTIFYENGRTNPDGSLKIGRKPLVYDYTGLAIMYGEEPADNESQVYELNSKNKEEESLMEFKELYEQEVEKNQRLEIEKEDLSKTIEEINAKVIEKDEAIVNATKILKEKEDEISNLTQAHAEINAKYEEKLAKEKELEVNSYFESIKDLFEEDETNSLKVFVESVDLAGLKAKEAEICTAKFKSQAVKTENKSTKNESEVNSLFMVNTEEVETIEYKSLSDIQ